jgi:hypothetical protein
MPKRIPKENKLLETSYDVTLEITGVNMYVHA